MGDKLKKVLIFGLRDRECLCDVEYFLDKGKYEIIGYSDISSSLNYWVCGDSNPTAKRLPFYNLAQLKNLSVSFDHIVIPCLNEAVTNTLVDKLKLTLNTQGGGVENKIVIPVALQRNSREKLAENSVQRIREAKGDYYGAIFGLSYSFKGIDLSRLSEKFYNFSYDGRDMYYNMQLFKYAVNIGKFKNLKIALLAFPPYYFNYDQSQSYNQYKVGQIYSVWELDDWHNYKKTKINLDQVENYIANYRMFGKKITEYFHGSYHTNSYIVYQGDMELARSYTVNRRLPTVTENISIFKEFIKILSDRGIRIIFALTPMLLSALNEESLHKVELMINDVSSLVKEISGSTRIPIELWDFTHRFADKIEMFRDLDHLNANGAVIFSDLIDDMLFGKKFHWNNASNIGYYFY